MKNHLMPDLYILPKIKKLHEKPIRRGRFNPVNDKELTESVRIHSQRLAELSRNLLEMHFSYKVKEKPSRQYWEKRVADFERYAGAGMEYYSQAHSIICLVDEKESQMFLLGMSKMRQLSVSLVKTMKEVAANPSIMDSRDRQQSRWSKDVKDRLVQQSDTCLRHEKEMNRTFREFYEKGLGGTAKG